ncbi:CoA pyrophosphatase [Fulvivirga sp. RKSG066]|nr:CoA pyrophosphatase [Fulvivirga aurantia]
MLEDLVKHLSQKVNNGLPGMEAQQLMMPVESTRERFNLDKKDVRRGGVLILLYQKEGSIFMPLTQRHDYGGTHGGQVSLPGGKFEEIDTDITSTALRETREEIGIAESQINVIGRLTDLYIPPSNFRVTPVIGYIKQKPAFEIDTFEVKELIEVRIDELLDLEKRKRKDITVRQGIKLNAPYFDLGGRVVWGATAMILSEFVTILDT